MKVVTNIRRSDLIRLQFHFLPRLKGNWIFVAVIAAAVVAWATYTHTGPMSAKNLLIAVFSGLIGGIAGLLITTAINSLAILAASTSKVGVLGSHEFEIRNDGLFERTSANEQLSKWSGIAAVEKASAFIYVKINGYLFHIIPRRSFTTTVEYDEFFHTLRNSWQSAAA